jgi:2-polyprenyl-6-methoxyphenol hydroxylase-like FAD-dependent oxidoreductase
VDGSGRGAACAVKIGARSRRLDELVGLVWRLEREGAGEPTLVEATPSGWWYSAAAPSGKTVVVFLTDAKEARGLRVASGGWPRQLLSDAPLMAQRVRGSSPEELPRVVAAFTQTLEPAAGDGWLAVGDAAISRDPISGSGVDFALASAELAAEAIVCAQGGDGSATRVYAALIRRDATAYLNERRSVYLAEDRWSDAPFWQRRREPLFVRPFADLTTTPR